MRWKDLQTRHLTRTSRGQYASARLPRDARLKLLAVVERMPAGYAFSGLTASYLLRLDSVLSEPIEVTIRRDAPVRARAGVKLRRAAVTESEVIVRNGFRLTSPMRTACDLGSQRDVVEGVVALDLALHAGVVTMPQLMNHVATHAGAKGIRRLRKALSLADGRSESAMETRLRIQLIMARLPPPSVQVDLSDADGNFLGRADLYYADRRLIMEFDGADHKDRTNADLRRHNNLLNAGFHILRFTAVDVRKPESVVARVRLAREELPVCAVDSKDRT